MVADYIGYDLLIMVSDRALYQWINLIIKYNTAKKTGFVPTFSLYLARGSSIFAV